MIVLHGAVSIGVGTGGLRGPVPAQYFAMYVLRSLQLSKTDIKLIISVYVMFSILLIDFNVIYLLTSFKQVTRR